MLQPLYSWGKNASRRLGGIRAQLDIFGMRKISCSFQGVEHLIIKPIEFNVCDINTYYKNCNLGAINCALIAIRFEFRQDVAYLMVL